MTFNSFAFLIFFPVVVAGYYAMPHRFRWAWLLLASCYFYMAFIPVFIFVLGGLILIDYTLARLIARSQGPVRKMFLWVSIGSTCTVLIVFKYFNFFNDSLAQLAEFLHWNYPIKHLSLLLPLGLSFHTFQSLSYVIEVYRGTIKPEKHFGIYSLYVMFFPQLVSGPIERPGHLLPQLNSVKTFDYQAVTNGLKLMAWGLFKKVVIADRLAMVVNHVYLNSADQSGLHLWLATFFFAFQIYCDFSGYSDIAVGAGQVLGYRLMRNFNLPYFAQSIPDYWQRWHISLSSWFRDYVFIPLGRKQLALSSWYKNIFITFLLSGLWHGANWTFVAWGGLHGLYYIIGAWSRPLRTYWMKRLHLEHIPTLRGIFSQIMVFVLVYFSWVLFRAADLPQAMQIYQQMFVHPGELIVFGQGAQELGVSLQDFYGCWLVLGILLAVENIQFSIQQKRNFLPALDGLRTYLSSQPVWVRWPVYVGIVLAIMNFGVVVDVPFIYFQF